MLLTEIFRTNRGTTVSEEIGLLVGGIVSVFEGLCKHTLSGDCFASDVLVVLDFVAEVARTGTALSFVETVLKLFSCQNMVSFLNLPEYNRIHYAVEFITVNFLKATN
jgi:hypothetical protein